MSLTLTHAELHEITGKVQPAAQLRVLHSRGFFRAAILGGRLVLERSHYDAVTQATSRQSGDTESRRPMLKSQRAKAATA